MSESRFLALQPTPTSADEKPMSDSNWLAVVLVIMAPFVMATVMFFTIRVSRHVANQRVVRVAEQVAGVRSTRWRRVAVATIIGWTVVTGVTFFSDPEMAVWLGGLVVAFGAALIIRSLPDPTRIDEETFDRELRALLEQA